MKDLEPRLQPVSIEPPAEPRLSALGLDASAEEVPAAWEERLWERMSAAWEEGDQEIGRHPLLASLEDDIHREPVPPEWEKALTKTIGTPLTLEEIESPAWPAEVAQEAGSDPFEPLSLHLDRALRGKLGLDPERADGSIFWILCGGIGGALAALTLVRLMAL